MPVSYTHLDVYKRQIEYVVRGVDIDAAAVARAVELSVENYCSVHAMLHKAADIRTAITIIQE